MKKKRKARNPSDKANPYPKKEERGMSQQAIADIYGLTRMRICQIEKHILEKLAKKKKLQGVWFK